MFREAVFMGRLCVKSILAVFAFGLLAGLSPLFAAQSDPGSSALIPYASCQFSDGLQIVETDPLAPGITSRDVDTDSGPRRIDMKAGVRVMFAYPDTDFYANVKAELLPSTNYAQLKQFLLDNFQYIAHGNIVNSSLTKPLNGFEAHGLDREKLEGGVLGVYLLFDDSVSCGNHHLFAQSGAPKPKISDYRGIPPIARPFSSLLFWLHTEEPTEQAIRIRSKEC